MEFTQFYKNIETTLETSSGDSKITISGVSPNEGLTLDYDLLTTAKQFKIDPTGAHWNNGTTTYNTTLEELAALQTTFQAVELPPNATTLKVVDKVLATNNITNDILLDASLNQITITDGTTTNTINKNGYTTKNSVQDLTHYLNFSDNSATGVGAIQKTTGLSCNPFSNTISATTVNTNNLNSNASYYINSSKRIYQTLNSYTGYANTTNGYYGLSKMKYPLPNPSSSGVKAVSVWTQRTGNVDSYNWEGICWSPELGRFTAVSGTGGGTTNRVMNSSNGITWTTTTGTPNSNFYGVCWCPQLNSGNGRFVAVGSSTAMYSNDGITSWTAGTGVPAVDFRSVCWSPELGRVVAVGSSTAMYSNDGVTWVSGSISGTNTNSFFGVCWSSQLGLFCATGFGGATNTRIITSTDGITWISQTTTDYNWINVCWSPELGLFVAVGNGTTSIPGNRVMTSLDGNIWIVGTTPTTTGDINWRSVCWSPELGLFCAVASNGTLGLPIMTSPDGFTWTMRTSVDNTWRSVCWSPELGIFCAVGSSGTNRVITSNFKGRPPTSYNVFDSGFNSIDQTGNWSITGTTTNANNILITSDNTSGTYYIPFSKSSAGTGIKPLFQDDTMGPLTYNPSTATLSTTTFSGALSGTATNATNATIAEENASTTFYPTFVNDNTGNLPLKVEKTGNPLTFIPSTGVLSATQLTATTQVNTSSIICPANELNITCPQSKTINLNNVTGDYIYNATSAGSLQGYMRISFNGTVYKIPYYNT